ncbi:Signal transduction histidine kinase [Mucilaginibacter mallensis]|uniref:histidine kinase n=1 Tax=Mucilaginibacter mallensis TaxID=652787 RepID=A0A1H1ZJE8_MUCMA|nr:HAMP domain-containing sensor histidine kinase [Mucilaginibacter mallensis]SDT33773.1 Signal transduction histidine kinase [Mucilaginibacter mallensis]
MKLSAHYNKASIIITISVLLIGGIIYFFTINYIAKNQLDINLIEEIDGVKDYIKVNNQLPKQVDFDEDLVIFVKTDKQEFNRRFFDTTYNNPKEKKKEAGRAVSCLVSLNGSNYLTTLIVSREDTEYLVQIIGLITLALSVGLLLTLFITSRYILNGLWKPFYKTLTELKSFNISDDKSLNLKSTKIDEFNELNNTVQAMSLKAKNDFQTLKEFTENASHEMQTPLAVITSKLDTLIQDETLKTEQYEQINDIYGATNKLARLNQSLLLLVKIENNLIDDIELLRLDILIEEKVKQFYELINDKQIQVTTHLSAKEISASKYLIDIMLNNLFSNAIRHNIPEGKLTITLDIDKLVFKNDGLPQPFNIDNMFDRFKKGNNSEGTGLGLAIVKNICTLNNWGITYFHEASIHVFQIDF